MARQDTDNEFGASRETLRWPEEEVWQLRRQKAEIEDRLDAIAQELTESAPSTEEWWRSIAQADFEGMLPKVMEYGGTSEGSADLRIMGFALSELRMPPGAPPEVQQEVACWFYALGKIARLISDYNQGKPGKPDTWHDLSVYSMMARRLQTVGRWP